MSTEAIKKSLLELGNNSVHFLNNVVESANIGIETGNTAAKKIGTVSIEGSTEITKQSFDFGKQSLVLSGEISKSAFEGTNEIAKIAFSETGRITFIVFNGSSNIIRNIFGAINFTAQAVGSKIKNYIDLKKDINDYMAIHGYDNSIKGQIKGHFNNSVILIKRIIEGVFRDLNKQFVFKLNDFRTSMSSCKKNIFYSINCKDETEQKYYNDIKEKIVHFKELLFFKKKELLNKIDDTTNKCLNRIIFLNDKTGVPALLNGLNKEVETMFDINEIYKYYNTIIDILDKDIDQKLNEQKSKNTVVNPNNIQTVVLPENSDNNSAGVGLEPVNPEVVNSEVVNTITSNSETGVNPGNGNQEPVNTTGGRKSRRKKHRKSKAKKTVGKRMKTHRRIRRR